MSFTFGVAREADPSDAVAWFVPVTPSGPGSAATKPTGAPEPKPSSSTDAEAGRWPAAWRRAGFTGTVDQVVVVPPAADDEPVVYVVAVAVPKAAADDADHDGRRGAVVVSVRRAAAGLARSLRTHASLAVELDGELGESAVRARVAGAVADGLAVGGYGFRAYKARPESEDTTAVTIVAGQGRASVAEVDDGVAAARAVACARDLVNTPGGDLTPAAFAEEAERLGRVHGFGVDVLDAADLTSQGYRGILAVNQGSSHPARFVKLTFDPGRSRPAGRLALVGKGITFDSGGLSIKTATGMMTMKSDMAGAAAVLAAFTRFSEVGVRATVTGYLPLTDNMTGPDAIRPGDVIRYRNGTSVEVLNTDAEGRLVLADALITAAEDEHDAIVDIATLTGAVGIALGARVAALMGNNEGLLGQVEAAAAATGERLWRMPLMTDERSRFDSDVADLRNIGKGAGGGSILAGLFLQEFVAPATPWAHLDIASTAWSDEVRGEVGRGATGYGVRLLVALARGFRRPKAGAARNA